MPPIKRRYFALLAVLIVILAIWTARVHLAEYVATTSMHYAGFSDPVIDIHRLGLEQSQVPALLFKLPTETGSLFIEIRNINIKYTAELLAEGQIDKLAIGRLTLHYDTSSKAGQQPDETRQPFRPREIVTALKHALREAMFFNTLSIQQITLNGEPFGKLNGKTLQLNAERDDNAIRAQLALSALPRNKTKTDESRTVIARLSEDRLDAELKFATRPGAAPARLGLKIGDTEITGDYDIDPELLQHWLQPFTDLKRINGIGKVNGTVSLNLETGDQLHAALTAKTDKLAFNALSADHIELNAKLGYSTDGTDQHLELKNGTVVKAGKLMYDSISLADTRLQMAGTLKVAADTWQYTGDHSIALLKLDYESQSTRFKDINAHVTANPDNVNIAGEISTATVPGRFSFDMVHNFASGDGRLALTPSLAINLNEENHSLSQLLTPWPYAFDLLTGSIELSAQAAWSKHDDFSLASTVRFDAAGGHVGEIIFSGLRFTHKLEILPAMRSLRASRITLDQVDSGVTASNINLLLAFFKTSTGPLPKVVVRKLRGEMFDGSITAEELVYDFNSSNNRFLINASDIDLSRIVETQQLEDIVVTGRIDGELPVEINETGIVIENGVFINTVRNGIIRYNPAAGTEQMKQNPLTGIALDALRDFRYDHLQAGVKYTPEGMLTISLELKGTSPELDTDRPVHLNIKTEQNLLSLLKSLRYAQGISEKVDKQVRRKYEDTQSKN